MSGPEHRGRLMGIDVGSKRTGVAISDELHILATPVGYVERGPTDRTKFRELVERYRPVALVAGMPAGLSGREGPQAADVRAYATALAADLELPLDYWDERMTSLVAERSMADQGIKRAKRKERIDAIAAAVMLQGFIDAQAYRRRR